MSTNNFNSMSIFDFVDDIDAFIDEWYEFHEEVYHESIPLQSFHKVKYLTLNFNGISIEETHDSVNSIININKTLKDINQKIPLGFSMIDRSAICLGRGILDDQFGDEDMFKEAA